MGMEPVGFGDRELASGWVQVSKFGSELLVEPPSGMRVTRRGGIAVGCGVSLGE